MPFCSKKSSWIGIAAVLLAVAFPGFVASADSFKVIPEHEEIEGPFEDGIDVTYTCLECHEEQAHDFMKTAHWTWSRLQEVPGKGLIEMGKRHGINNFCVGVASNLESCTECHAGYGWKDDSFDFSDPSRVDCLVCHDTTRQYKRLAGVGGQADLSSNLELIAKKVGPPGRHNCGTCHFYGGGGHAVKHGDLESSLIDADSDLDIHMDKDGLNFSCQTCHVTEKHDIPGHSMADSPGGKNPVRCINCHDGTVHEKPILNQHAETVACQTCHVPSFARRQPTKTDWDWSAAEKGREALYINEEIPRYLPYKGDFLWDSNIVPEYAWFNGTANIYTWGEKVNPDEVIALTDPIGDKSDQNAKIYPFKIHRGRQAYDSVNNYLINPHLSGDTGFWEQMDWQTSATIGMQARGLDYSGEYDFVNTVMYWRINHMVEKAARALDCRDCHGRQQQRMDWQKLGYDGDPLYRVGQARKPLKDLLGDKRRAQASVKQKQRPAKPSGSEAAKGRKDNVETGAGQERQHQQRKKQSPLNKGNE